MLQKLSLRFSEAPLERAFLQQRLQQARRFNRTAALLGCFSMLVFMFSDWLQGPLLMQLLPYRLGGIGLCLVMYMGCSQELGLPRGLDALVSICSFGFYFLTSYQVFALFPDTISGRYILPSALLCMAAVFSLLDLRLDFKIMTGSSIAALAFLQEWLYLPDSSYDFAHYLAGFLIGAGGAYLTERYRRLNFYHDRQASIERDKSERLLLNILPAPIARRLRDDHKTLVDGFENVTVLFADIVGFTPMSSQLSPHELLQRLNHIFSAFDSLAEKHGLEKIKTIGDAYMVAGGLPEHQSNHADRVALLALDIQESLQRYSEEIQAPLSMRMGIHQGPVVAGVIGRKKFIYDLWGDTVNIASRMESHGVAGRIQVSKRVYETLCDRFEFESRGPIAIKGKGEMDVYFLVGQRKQSALGALETV